MKNLLQKTHLRALMLVVLMLCGVGTTWGQTTVKYVFTTADWNATINGAAANWTSGKVGTGFSNNGIQVSTATSGANGTSPVSYENISKIVVTYNTNKSAGKGSIVSQIGENASTTNNVAYTSGDGRSANYTTEFTYTKPQTGNIKLIVNTTTNSIYLVSAEITYTPSVPDTRTEVNMTSFAAENTTLIKGNTTLTSVSNDQPNWAAAYTYSSNNTNVATINENGVITAEGKGTATITASLNIDTNNPNYKVGETASKTIDITVNNPSHTATFSINGTTSTADFEEGTAITFPTNPADIEDKTFVGWGTETIAGNTDEMPTLLTTATMGKRDVSFYAVFATKTAGNYTEITDVLNNENTINNTANTYSAWKDIRIFSDAFYAGNSAGQYSSIQLRSNNNNSGIVSTTSGGKVSKITVVWNSNTTADRTLDIYGSNTAYSSASDLYNTSARGTKIGSITIGSSTDLTITGDYAYIGLRSNSGALYLDEISITWANGTPDSYSAYCTTVEAEQPVVEPGTPVEIAEGYYSIKNGNGQYVNVAGRKTVTFVDEADIATAPGTVIRVKADDKGQVQILRSQGVDIPGYAEKAMNYVPKIVKLVVDKLHAEGSGTILGENGLDAIMAKFDESFDYHLYTEQAEGGVRIYGKTPSMQPVVDFYAENKTNVDAKLPMLETFINDAIQKILNKTNGSGASILVPFSLETVWQKMGGTLTEPVDDASKLAFLQQVLANKENVWKFAYETAMIYWKPLINHQKVKDNLAELGDLAQYVEKLEYIRPDVKYYLVQNSGKMDVFSQDNPAIISNEAGTLWTLENRSEFKVAIPEDNLLNGKYYTTLYTDFAYTLPEGVKAYKVTAINETTGVATTEEISGTIPAQTPVLLSTTNEELTQTLTLDVNDAGTAPTDNLLVGPDYLINTYNIKTEQVEGLFNVAKELLGENAYSTYLAEYEHLMMRNSGTVNNKYFFGLDEADLELCTYKNEDDVDDCVVRSLSTGDEKLGFYNNWEVKANQAFLVSDKFNPVKLTLKGDVTRDGLVNVNDVTATVDITLNKATLETHSDIYDFDAADADDSGAINVTDVIIIVNLSLGKE